MRLHSATSGGACAHSARAKSYRQNRARASVQRLDEHESPLPTGPQHVWLSDATVVGSEVDADEWPDWCDQVAYRPTEGGEL
jgi:hypothetical protein